MNPGNDTTPFQDLRDRRPSRHVDQRQHRTLSSRDGGTVQRALGSCRSVRRAVRRGLDPWAADLDGLGRYLGIVRFVSMCGSLGSTSANRLALDLAIDRLTSAGATDSVVEVPLAQVPMFDPDRVDNPPAEVIHMRSLIEAADGVLLAAPEYAGGLAGGMKNALDWLVGSSSLYRRPVVVLSAGTTGGLFAIEQLVRTLSWQGALTVGSLGIKAPRTKIEAGVGFVDVPTVRGIEQWADALVAATSMTPESLLERVASIVEPFGIDPARFGDLR
jgi:chromate reductase